MKKRDKGSSRLNRLDGLPKSLLTVFYADYQRFPTNEELLFIKNEIIVHK